MPRQARLDSPGTLHHVIIRRIEKKRIIKDDTDRADVVDEISLAETAWHLGVSTPAICNLLTRKDDES